MKEKILKITYLILNVGFVALYTAKFMAITFQLILGQVQADSILNSGGATPVLELLICVVGICALFLPKIVEKIVKGFKLPLFMRYYVMLYIFSALFLGELMDVYNLVPIWDSILHAGGGVIFVYVSVVLLREGNKLSPFKLCLFAFSLSALLGMLWEVFEFSGDSIFGTNMQRYIASDGTVLIGHEALIDTMKDILLDIGGSFISALAIYRVIKSEKKSKTFEVQYQQISENDTILREL
ncbi:MAG: hypothetical protein LBM99_03260 [Bacillales bacterium]|jgi:hypothetical protein|nr:hypothetical protein [Bacillales bacterium]